MSHLITYLNLCKVIQAVLNFPFMCSEMGIHKKQRGPVQVDTDAQATFIANPPADETGGDGGFRHT